MSTDPDSHEPGVAYPRESPDSLVAADDSEEDGVDNPVEPPPWSSSGSTSATTAEGTAGETGGESPSYTSVSPFGNEDAYGLSSYGAATPGQEGPASYGFGQDTGYIAGSASGQAAGTATYSYDPDPPPAPAATGYRVPQPRAAVAGASAAAGQRRRANLVVARLEPWSVMKFSFLMSLVAWVVLFVAVALLYFLLSSLGVFSSIQSTLSGVTSSQGSSGFNLASYLSASKVLGYTMLLGAVNIVLITALSTLGAMIYNVVTHLGGGIEVTLRETD